jgi:type I restriction enzyme S subunit
LGEIAEGLTSLSGKTAKDFGHGNAFYVPYINVYENAFVDINRLQEVNISDNETQNAVRYGDILFTVSSETPDEAGLSSVFLHDLENCYVNSFCTIYRPRSNVKLSPVFSGYYFRINLVREHFIRNAQGAIRFNLNREAFNQTPVLLPSLPEQQKIADCLSSLDEVIELQAKKLEALQAHKKGLMQQLFPREGETTPRLRFPEFRDAGPWEVKRLGEICSFIKGKGLPKTAITAEGSVPCIHYGELFTEYGEVIRKVKSCTNTTTDSVLSEEDDVLMPTSDVTPNGLAKASCIKEKNVVLGGDILVIRPNKQQVFGEYLSRYIRYQEKDVLRLVTGTTVFHLYGNAISHLRVSLPRMSEQQKIADCLSSLDELIELQAKQLEALKAHKKGLMQQLFPQEIDL